MLISDTLSWKSPTIFSWEDVFFHLSLEESFSTACSFHEEEERVGIHSYKGQNTLFIGELLHFAKISFKKSNI